jgi:DNA-binding beta-propeller fold protein YncE
VVPSWDLRTLWVTDGTGLTPIDPRTGLAGKPVKAAGDLSFTPDGRHALLLAPRRIELRTPRGMKPQGSIRVPCREPHDLDFAADGSFAVASCARRLVRVDPRGRRVTGLLDLGPRATPQDILLSPDGTVFYVADRAIGGVWLIDAATFRKAGFLGTGPGAHGLALSRDGSTLYVAGAGSVARIDTATRLVMGQWPVGGPDIGGVSDDGTVLWLTGDKTVEAVSTADGEVLRRLRGGTGLCFFPQPGRYSLGDTMR